MAEFGSRPARNARGPGHEARSSRLLRGVPVWSGPSRSARGRPRDLEGYGASRRAWRGPAFPSPRPAFASRGRFQAGKLQLPESSSVAAPAVGLWELKSARLGRAAAGARAETSEASPAGETAVQTLPFPSGMDPSRGEGPGAQNPRGWKGPRGLPGGQEPRQSSGRPVSPFSPPPQ